VSARAFGLNQKGATATSQSSLDVFMVTLQAQPCAPRLSAYRENRLFLGAIPY
jgi:hypothetical protein